MNLPWFSHDSFTELVLRGPSPIAEPLQGEVVIDDEGFIARLVERIERIDPDGRMMNKPGPEATLVQAEFRTAQGDDQLITLLQWSIQTPSTGFHSRTCEDEASVVADLRGLLEPALDKPLPVVVGHEYEVEGFRFTYLGSEQPRVGPIPTTASVRVNCYRVCSDEDEQQVEVVFGQTPPAPKEFEVNRLPYTLLTYQTEDGESLYPHRFIIRAGRH